MTWASPRVRVQPDLTSAMYGSIPPHHPSPPRARAGSPSLRFLGGALAVVAFVWGCGGTSNTTTVEDPVPTTLSITPDIVAFSFIGEARSLTAIVRDQNNGVVAASVTWSSSEPGIVSVDANGLVTAVTGGTSLITASAAGLTAELSITVEVAASSIIVQEGDGQDAIAGSELPDSILVEVLDFGGTPVADAEVFFRPDSAAGSVRDSMVVTGPDGRASTTWTLGSDFGPMSLVVASGTIETVVSSFSRSATPIADLVFASELTLSRLDPTPFDSLTATATVKNQGDLTTGGPFRLSAVVGGSELAFQSEAALAPDEERQVSITFSGFGQGAQDVRLELDRGDALPELIESNNEVSRSVNVLQQTQLTLGVPLTGLTAAVGEEILLVLDVPPGSGDALNITITDPSVGSADDLDLFVAEGVRPAFREDYPDCVSANPSTSEACQIVFPEGTYHILLHAWEDETGQFTTTGFTDVTIEASIGATIEPYDLDYTLIASFTTEQAQAIDQAVSYWEDIIRGDLTTVEGTSALQNPCGLGQPPLASVDDMHLYVGLLPDSLQGDGGTLASAGWCGLRPITYLPYLGLARFDPVDLANMTSEDVFRVMLHEIGHTLGFGSTWQLEGLLQDPSLDSSGNPIPGTQDTHFTGDGAKEAFADIAPAYVGARVPVENASGLGSGDSHWRESVFNTELMTPAYDGGVMNPLSAVTIRSMEDLGYGVDVTQAESYLLPVPSPGRIAPRTRVTLDLRDDVMPPPDNALGPKHRLRRVRR